MSDTMSENPSAYEPAPATPTTPSAPAASPPSKSLWSHLFSLNSIGFYIMIGMTLVGASYTFSDSAGSRWYWERLVPPVFGLVCIMVSWPGVEPTVAARLRLIGQQVLHWAGVLLTMQIAFLASGDKLTEVLDGRQVSFFLMQTTMLGTFLAGVYLNWRLCLVALVLAACSIGLVVLQSLAPLLAVIGVATVIVYFAWTWWYRRWQTSHPSPAAK